MLSLAEIQLRIRDAIVDGETAFIAPLLVGGREPLQRLAIHERQYESSLKAALIGKFPATSWLVGARFLDGAATVFVHERPPHAPCIAEYGKDFPEFLSTYAGSERVPYLRAFAELEWSVGVVSIAIDQPAIDMSELQRLAPTALADVGLELQPGLRYLLVSWPVDDLMKLYLTDATPDQFTLEPSDTWVQIRGARGAFGMSRLGQADFVFRAALLNAESLGRAAERALEAGADFDPGGALARVFDETLVTGIVPDGDRTQQ
jgi:hypothetical protein